MFHRFALLISLILLVSIGCTSAAPTTVPPTTYLITQESTAVSTEQPISPPQSDLSLTFAYPPPPPQPTSPYPGPTPNPYATRRVSPSPTPTIAVNPVENCDLSPSFSRCGGTQLTGKLAYFPTNGQLTVLDFDAEAIWISSQAALKDVDWSPAGDRLLVHDDIFRETYFYHQEGMLLHSESSGWVKWGTTDNHIRAGAYLWNEDYSIAAYIDRSQPQQAMAQFDFQDDKGRKEWPLEDFEVYYGSPTFWEWVPPTEWILVGYGLGGVGTTTITGYHLMALNARSGEMRDSGIWTQPEHIDWHPSETGLLVATDFAKSEMGRIGALVTWQILENQVTYLTESNHYASSPVWSPDGRYIAYSDYDGTWQNHLAVLDMETGLVTARANQADFPAWSQDGMTIFYLEMGERRDSALIRAIGRDDGEPLTVAEGRFPSCPGLCQPRTVFDYTP